MAQLHNDSTTAFGKALVAPLERWLNNQSPLVRRSFYDEVVRDNSALRMHLHHAGEHIAHLYGEIDDLLGSSCCPPYYYDEKVITDIFEGRQIVELSLRPVHRCYQLDRAEEKLTPQMRKILQEKLLREWTVMMRDTLARAFAQKQTDEVLSEETRSMLRVAGVHR